MTLTTINYRKFMAAGLVALMMFSLLALLATDQASAHGRRTLVNDKYEIVFGFLGEPAFTGGQNGIDLTVCQGKCDSNDDGSLKNPIKDADKTMKAEVIFGSQTLPVELKPRFRADGKYNGYFFPSKAGEYTFHFTGTINGDKIDERVVSGKDGFNSVEDPKLFPAAGGSALDQQVKDANDKASSATTFGIIGIVVGVLGLIAGGISLALRPKAVATSMSQPRETVGSGTGRGPQGG